MIERQDYLTDEEFELALAYELEQNMREIEYEEYAKYCESKEENNESQN